MFSRKWDAPIIFASKLHSVRRGKILVSGKACATDPNGIQITPLSSTHCIAYKFFIAESRATLKGTASQTVLHQESRGQWNLSLQTPMGKVKFRPRELDLDKFYCKDRQNLVRQFSDPRSLALLTKKGINSKLLGVRRSLQLAEFVIRRLHVYVSCRQYTYTYRPRWLRS